MSRFLFVVPPLTGHVNPAAAVAGELARRGHEVAFAAHADLVGPLLPPDMRLIALPAGSSESDHADLAERGRGLRGPASLKFLWADFLVPLGHQMVPGVEAAVDAYRPDVLVADQQAIGAALVGRRRGMTWATLATTSAEFDAPYAVMAGVGEWVSARLAEFAAAHGVPPGPTDLRFSEHLTLVATAASLLRTTGHPEHHAFVGALTGARRTPPDFPWEWLDRDSRPCVLVSLGTVTREAGGRFLTAAFDAVAAMGETCRAVVVAPPGLFEDGRGGAPDTVLVRAGVPQLELLRRMRAVVCHAGNNTVCEALARGLPLVVAPIRDDQPIVAEQVVRAGAGVRVRFGRATPAALRDALSQVLGAPGFHDAAARLAVDFAAAGGAPTAADRLEKIC
jgi:MGT family glycosyltransferase